MYCISDLDILWILFDLAYFVYDGFSPTWSCKTGAYYGHFTCVGDEATRSVCILDIFWILFDMACSVDDADIHSCDSVSYTHLTLPTIA